MSSPPFSQSGQYDDTEIITLYDEEKRPLECYIENAIEYNHKIYLLLMPIDLAIVILTEDSDDPESEYSETTLVEDSDEIDGIFDDAKAVLAELNLSLKRTGFTLTATGELPPLEEDNILSLDLDEDNNSDIEAEELQYLASFYHLNQKYNICTPLSPILFVAQRTNSGKINMVKGEDRHLQSILEELLFEEYDNND